MKINFSIKRVWLLIKATAVIDYKRAIYNLIYVTIILCVVAYMQLMDELRELAHLGDKSIFKIDRASTEGLTIVDNESTPIYPFVMLFVVFACPIIYSVFKNSIKKLSQTFTFTLPATIAEKYTANTLITLALTPIFIIICTIATEIVLTIIFKLQFGVKIASDYTIMSEGSSLAHILTTCLFLPLYITAFFSIIPVLNTGVKSRTDRVLHIIAAIFCFGLVALFIFLPAGNYETVLSILFGTATLIAWIMSYRFFRGKELKA